MKKNVVKLNENALRQIVAESVKKVLKEDNAYGLNVRLHEELGKLYDAAFNIAKELSLTKKNSMVNSNYDPKAELYEWAKKITQDAEEWNKRKF